MRWRRWRACSRPTTSIRWASTPSASCSRRTSTSRCCARAAGPELLIAATDVATGPPAPVPPPRDDAWRRCWPRPACRRIHHAVAIDGHAYWDGGFSANPDLVTLGRESPCGDTLIVKLNAHRQAGRADDRARDHRAHQPDHLQPADAARHRGDRDRAARTTPLVGARQAARCAARPPSLPSDRGRPLHQRAGAREQGQAGARAAALPARRRPQRDREVAGPQPRQHRPHATVDLGARFLEPRPAPSGSAPSLPASPV